jgi:hypothetical protein
MGKLSTYVVEGMWISFDEVWITTPELENILNYIIVDVGWRQVLIRGAAGIIFYPRGYPHLHLNKIIHYEEINE